MTCTFLSLHHENTEVTKRYRKLRKERRKNDLRFLYLLFNHFFRMKFLNFRFFSVFLPLRIWSMVVSSMKFLTYRGVVLSFQSVDSLISLQSSSVTTNSLGQAKFVRYNRGLLWQYVMFVKTFFLFLERSLQPNFTLFLWRRFEWPEYVNPCFNVKS